MRSPEFWQRDGWAARLLAPAAWISAGLTARRVARAPTFIAPVPVFCVGNITLGGTGKTPVTADLAARLRGLGRQPAILMRGYGGREKGPLAVDPTRHDAAAVGDEALELIAHAPVFIGGDRAASARLALTAGAEALLLDDGFQNPGLAKNFSLLVFDGPAGLGNERVFPAGPLRESLTAGRQRAAAAVILGPDDHGLAARLAPLPVLHGRLIPDPAAVAALAGRRVVGFAGIGRPEKFFASLRACGADLVAERAFADHHLYRPDELAELLALAARLDAVAVTTEKDRVRLPAAVAAQVLTLPVRVGWDAADRLNALLTTVVESACPAPGGAVA